jgi:hypothetical protein
MADLNSYFWHKNLTGSHQQGLPPQALPLSKKGKKWKEANMDFFEIEAIQQFIENTKYNDYYRMVEGKLSFTELSEVAPQLRDLEQVLDNVEIPAYIKHYDLIGVIINALVGELLQSGDKFHVTNTDEIGTNEYQRTRTEMFQEYINQEFNKELQLKLSQRGLNPEGKEFASEEEQQAFMQKVQQTKDALTPPEIQKYMDTQWKPQIVMWGEYTLEADSKRFFMDALDRDQFKDFLITGRCFRHFQVGYDFYRPERWSPLNTFFSKSVDTREAEKCDYIGRLHFFTPEQLVDRYSHKLSAKIKEDLVANGREYYGGTTNQDAMSFGQQIQNNFHQTEIVPFPNLYDYNLGVSIEDSLGIPMATQVLIDGGGGETSHPTFMPRREVTVSQANRYAQFLRDDIKLRTDIVQVTEVYFKSYERIAYLTYYNAKGVLTQKVVTDDLLNEFIKEHDISTYKSITLEELEKTEMPNTIVYDYIPRYYSGVKINSHGTTLKDDIYFVEPLEYQIKGDSNMFDVKAPVAGIIDTNVLANKINPFQVPYNVTMNQLMNLLEKEIGLFYIFDIGFLTAEHKEWGNTEEALINVRNIAKDVGLLGVDSTNRRVGGTLNQMSPVNMSLSAQIADRVQLALFYQNKAFEQIGVTPQRLGSPVKYETAEGVRQGTQASYAQTEVYFSKYFEFKAKALEIHLNVAQFCQKNDKDITVYYTKSDATKAFLKFSDPDFHLRKLGIMPDSNSKKRKELEMFKNYLIQNNTMGLDELSLAQLISSDSFTEVIHHARMNRLQRENADAIQHKRNQENIELQDRLERERQLEEFMRNETSKQADRDNKIRVEEIESLGRAIDGDAEASMLQYIMDATTKALEADKFEHQREITKRQEDRADKKEESDRDLRYKELDLKIKELQERVRKRQSDEYIAGINKN